MRRRNPSNILGVDASLTSTGVAWDQDTTFCIRPKCVGVERMVEIRNVLTLYAEARHVDLVVLEGPAFGAKGRAGHDLAGLHWVLRVAFHHCSIAVAVVPPTTLKKFATGKGNVDKGAVLVEAVRRLGYEGSSHDEADALWLHQMGLHHRSHPDAVKLPQDHLGALEGVVWPDPRNVILKVAHHRRA